MNGLQPCNLLETCKQFVNLQQERSKTMFGVALFIGMVAFAVIYALGGFRDKDGTDNLKP